MDNRPVATALVAAIVSLNALFHLVNSHGDELWIALVVGFALGQAAGLAGWLVFGKLPFLLRFGLTAIAIVLISSTMASNTRRSVGEWIPVVTSVVALTAMLFLLRRPKFQLVEIHSSKAESISDDRKWQWSLIGLFRLVTVAAIVLGVIQWGRRSPVFNSKTDAAYIGMFSLVGGLALWSALARDNRIWRLFIVVFMAPLLGASLGLFSDSDPWPIMSGIMTFLAMTSIVSGLLIRVAGYQLLPRK